jgi:hypothetical protein
MLVVGIDVPLVAAIPTSTVLAMLIATVGPEWIHEEVR